MRILALVHLYPPRHNAGAELMLHTLLREMVDRDHEARVLVARETRGQWVHENVTCSRVGINNRTIEMWFRWADVVLTHLDLTSGAVRWARKTGKPLVHLVHNERQLAYHGVKPETAQLVIFNSEWIRDAVNWPGPAIVLAPPVVAEDYRTTPGDAITLVNLSLSKGAEVFYELAERMPERPFLGVKGAYARQVVPKKLPENVTILENAPRMREVYGRTRLLLMPSDYESWGRVAIEAAASGIPTIAHPTLGLQESLSTAGIFCDRDDVDGWEELIRFLDESAAYREHSERVLARSKMLNPRRDFDLFENALQALVRDADVAA